MAAVWRSQLFGGLRAIRPGAVVTEFESRQTAALFAYLALHPDRSQPKDLLVELIWPESDPAAARRRLNQALYALRKQFETPEVAGNAIFVSDWGSIHLNGEAIVTDAGEFEDALAGLRLRNADAAKLEDLDRAIGLYRGDLVPELYSEWIDPIRTRYAGMRMKALEWRCRLLEQSGDLRGAILSAEQLIDIEPLEEEHYLTLIRLYGLQGQTPSAVKQFRRLEKMLREEFREPPSTASRNLIESILQSEKAAVRDGAASPMSESTPLKGPRIQDPMTRFFGRETELATLTHLVSDDGARLVTLVGAGGCGKTRLSIELARASDTRFGGNIWFVSLAELSNAGQISDAILGELDQQRSGTLPLLDRVATHLKSCPAALLILDNFEHVVEEGAPIVRDLLQRVPKLQILITSRRRLGLAGEQEIAVGPLPVPEDSHTIEELVASPSLQLYIDRARAANLSFQVTEANARVLRKICQRLDGVPLALELSAALSSSMSPTELLQGLENRFELLVSRKRDIPDRHRSLRAAVEYGFDRLAPELQRAFSRLSVFQDGWTVEAAAFVCELSDARGALLELHERSLIRVEAATDSTASRYSMFETLREFGWELMGKEERETARRLLATYYVELQGSAGQFKAGIQDAAWINIVEAERRNMVFALGWCWETGDVAKGLRIAAGLEFYWESRGPSAEGREWIGRLLAAADERVPDDLCAGALWAIGRLAWSEGEFEASRTAHEQSLAIYERLDDSAGMAKALYNLGIVEYRLGNHAKAREETEKSLEIARRIQDSLGIARALLNLGNIELQYREFAKAKRSFDESYELERRHGNHIRAASLLNNLGSLAYEQRKYVLAARYFEECVAELRRYGSRSFLGLPLSNLGLSFGRQGFVGRGVQAALESIQASWDSGVRYELRCGLLALALLAAWGRDAESAGILFGLVDRMNSEMKVSMIGNDEDEVIQSEAIERSRERMGTEAFDAAREYGTTLTDERGAEFAFQWAENYLKIDPSALVDN